MTALCAIIAVRNEAPYLRTLLEYLRDQSVDVVVLDNGSTDGSRELASRYAGAPVIEIIDLPYAGYFDLTAQICAKTEIISQLSHDWIIHQDADEILQSASENETLVELAARTQSTGLLAVDFDEFAFLPDDPAGYPRDCYLETGSRYYFFQPRLNRLNRLFKRDHFGGFENNAGHNIKGITEHHCLPNQVLRHYLVRSVEHAREKYISRQFSPTDIERGMHARRLNVAAADFEFDTQWPVVRRLATAQSRTFDRTNPRRDHYWEWPRQ